MKSILAALVLVTGACAQGTLFGRTSKPAAEGHYRLALYHLDPANERGSLDSALTSLNAYLASSESPQHAREATILRRLALEAQQLERIETALHQRTVGVSERRGDVESPVTRPQSVRAAPRPESVREIQRLREELREANAELERIRKRLAAPKTDSTDTK